MRNIFVILVAVFMLVTCGGGVKKHTSSGVSAGSSTVIKVDSKATEYAIQLDGGNEVWMEKSATTFTTNLINLHDGVHFIECIDEQANRQEVCNHVLVNGFRQCTYIGDLRYKVRFTKPVTKDDEGCDTVVMPPSSDCTVTGTCQPLPPPPPGGTPVAVTDITFTYCSYDRVYAYNLTAYCSINAGWVASTMTPTAANSSCQKTTYTNVPTNKVYACNVWDPVGLVYLYDPKVLPRPNDAFLANGGQITPYGNDVSLPIDQYGQIVWTGENFTFTIYPSTALSAPVIMSIGNEPNMKNYVMTSIGGGWQVTVPLAYGLEEVQFTSGTYTFLTPTRQDGNFYIQGVATPLPGVSITEGMSVTYANQVAGPPPNFYIDSMKNFLVRLTPASINGQATTVVIGITVTLPP